MRPACLPACRRSRLQKASKQVKVAARSHPQINDANEPRQMIATRRVLVTLIKITIHLKIRRWGGGE